MARVLIPCYASGPAIVVSDDDTVLGPARVAHKHLDGSWVRVNEDGSIGSTPADKPVGPFETAAVANELRVFSPVGRVGYPFRMTDPNTVPNV